jgi:adenine deaminase
VNSDDPAYFGGYVADNFLAVSNGLELSTSDIVQLAKNSFAASFLDDTDKRAWLTKIDDFVARHTEAADSSTMPLAR